MIRNRLGLGLIGVDCRQCGVLCDGDLIARVDELAVFRFPSAEVFGSFRRKYAGGAAAYILLVIYFFALALNVCDREAVLCGGEERGNRNGAVKLGIYIEQRAVGINPSGGLFFCEFLVKQLFKLFGFRKLCAVRNFNRFGSSVRRGRQVNLSFNNRRLPLCVERNVLCRHCFAGEIIRCACAKLIVIPACKHKVCGYTGRFIRRVVDIGNILLILAAFGFCLAAVNELDVIGVAGIVESCVVVTTSILRTTTVRKASNWILIFFCYSITRTRACIRMMQFILNSIIGCRSALTGKNLHIIICSLTTPAGLRSIEFRTIQWHGINIYLIWTSGRINTPSVAALVSRPLIADVRAIFRRNSKACILVPTIIIAIGIEFYVINISLIINVYDCGTVTGNGFLFNRLCGKTVIFFRRSFRFRTCFALLGFSFLQRIAVVICIFLPMDNGVFRFGIGFPVCGNGSRFGNLCNRVAVCVIPTVKRVAVAGGGDRVQVKRRSHLELRRYVVAALGIKRDPEAGFNYRVNVCIAGYKCDRCIGRIAVLRGAPADNAFIFTHGKLDFCGCGVQICFRDCFTGFACGGVINHLCTVFIHEVHVAVAFKLRRNGHFRAADSRDCAEA